MYIKNLHCSAATGTSGATVKFAKKRKQRRGQSAFSVALRYNTALKSGRPTSEAWKVIDVKQASYLPKSSPRRRNES